MTEELYLSQEGKEEMEEELEELKEERKELTQKIKEAREYGDLSENAEYKEAKNRQSLVESKISKIEQTLKKAKVVSKTSGDTIGIGSTVKIDYGDKEVEYTLMGSNEASPAKGKISNESPLGKALMGKQEGQEVEVQTPDGDQQVKIKEVA